MSSSTSTGAASIASYVRWNCQRTNVLNMPGNAEENSTAVANAPVEALGAHDRERGPAAAALPAVSQRERARVGELRRRAVHLEHLLAGVRAHELGGRSLRDDAAMRHHRDDVCEPLGLLD